MNNVKTSDLIIESYSTAEIKAREKDYKQIKQLMRKVTGEQLKIYEGDRHIICKYNNKPIGMCSISMKSPAMHFLNETEEGAPEKGIPYLYNYVCDITQKSKKPSVALIKYIYQYITSSDIGPKINLDIKLGNTHAMQFFEKNGFKRVGEYGHSIHEYVMYTADISKSGSLTIC